LELPPDAERGDLGLVELGEVGPAVEHHLALVGPRLAGDDVHHGGLAGAVGADDGAHLARLDQQREVVQRLEAVERDRDAAEVEERRGALHAELALRRRNCCHRPTTPRGRNSVTAMNRAPSANSQTSGSAPVSQVSAPLTRKAPITGPTRVPRPPTATQITASIELAGENSLGLMMPTCGTYSAPATPAMQADSVNTRSL